MTFTPTSHPGVKNVFCFLSRKVYFANTVLVQSELLLRRLKAGDCLWSVLATETPPERRSPPRGGQLRSIGGNSYYRCCDYSI